MQQQDLIFTSKEVHAKSLGMGASRRVGASEMDGKYCNEKHSINQNIKKYLNTVLVA